MWNKALALVACLSFLGATAQERDAGLWAAFSLNSEVSKKLELSVSPEVRFNENLSEMASYFVDISGQYKLNKGIYLSGGYRAGGRNAGDYYNLRQRIQLGLNFKRKIKDFTLSWAPRWQGAIQGASTENDGDFVTTLRNRFKLVYGGIKKYELASSFEFFNVTSLYSPPVLQSWRWIASVERDLKRGQAVSIGYLVQKDLTESPMEMDFIFLVNYSLRLDIYKKKGDKGEEKSSGGHDHN